MNEIDYKNSWKVYGPESNLIYSDALNSKVTPITTKYNLEGFKEYSTYNTPYDI